MAVLVLGLTGGMGSGKTTVAGIFRRFGAGIIDVDQVARELVMPGRPALKEIVRCFGHEVLNEDGTLDRRRLGDIVFNNREELARLDAIMYPRMFREVRRRLRKMEERRHGNGDGAYRRAVVIDAAILLEAGMDRLADKVIAVYAKDEIRAERIIKRTGLSHEDALARMRAQGPQSCKVERADFVIDNSGSEEDTLRQASEIWRKLGLEKWQNT